MRINVTRSVMPDYGEFCEEIRDLWDTRILTNNGPKAQKLEALLKEKLQAPHLALFVNGHLALEAILAALELKGEVITTPFTFASTTHAIVRKGLKPVFCDIRESDYTLDPERLESLITPETCAILPVHVYGNICDTEAIQKIADRHGLPVIYDAAHAFGETVNGVSSGSFGKASMFSLHATKVYHAIEGGIAVTSDPALDEKLRLERNYGITGPEDAVLVGGNAKMNEFQAVMGILNLRGLQDAIDARRRIHELYCEELADLPGLRLPPVQEGVERNYAYFPVYFSGGSAVRDAVCEALARDGIYARKYFYPLTCDFSCYRNQPGYEPPAVPVARRISGGIATLPLYPELPPEEARNICRIVREELKHV